MTTIPGSSFWHRRMLKAHLIISLPQPWHQPFLQGSMIPFIGDPGSFPHLLANRARKQVRTSCTPTRPCGFLCSLASGLKAVPTVPARTQACSPSSLAPFPAVDRQYTYSLCTPRILPRNSRIATLNPCENGIF